MVSSQTATTTASKQQVAYLMAEDSPGNYQSEARLSVVSESGVYGVIYNYPSYLEYAYPDDVAVDTAGHLIVAECGATTDDIAQVTLSGTRTVVYSTAKYSCPAGVQIDAAGNYIVELAVAHELVKVTPAGKMTVIHRFWPGASEPFSGWGDPIRAAIDSSGNYIVTLMGSDELVKVTPAGVATVIYNFTKGTAPDGVAIDSSGNYIVAEVGTKMISRITPSGERTLVYKYAQGGNWNGLDVALDTSGNYIVAEYDTSTLAMITPDGVRTVISVIPSSPDCPHPSPTSVEVVNASLFQTTTSTTFTSTSSVTGTPSTTVTTSTTSVTSTTHLSTSVATATMLSSSSVSGQTTVSSMATSSSTTASPSTATSGSASYTMYVAAGAGVAVVGVAAALVLGRRHH